MNLWNGVRNALSRKTTKQTLSTEIATRERSMDYAGIIGILPNPDPVLKKMGKDISVYRDIKADGHVRSVVQSRKSGALSKEWKVEPGDSSALGMKAAELCAEVMKADGLANLVKEILNTPLFGFGVLEVMWKPVNGRWLPVRVAEKPQEWFGFDEENRLRFISRENMLEGELLPPRKFLLAQYDASYINPYGEAVLASCFWPYVFKKGGMKFWVTFAEKYGMPYMIGKLPRGASDDEHEALLDKLEQMVQDAVATIPDDGAVEILSDSNKSASSDLYDTLIHAMNAEISKAVLGQTLTTEMGKNGGAYAASNTHQEVRKDLVEADLKLAASVVNRLFGWICELNMPDAPRPSYKTVEEEELNNDRADRDDKLTKQGVRFKKSYYAQTYNLDEKEFDLTDPAIQGSGAGAAFAEFAESSSGFTADRVAMENLVEESAARAGKGLADSLEPVIRLIENAESYDEIKEKLAALYPDMKGDKAAEVLEQALFVAETWGRLNG